LPSLAAARARRRQYPDHVERQPRARPGDRDGYYGTPGPDGAPEAEFVAWLDELQAEWVRAARRPSLRIVAALLRWAGPQISGTFRREAPRARTAAGCGISWSRSTPCSTTLPRCSPRLPRSATRWIPAGPATSPGGRLRWARPGPAWSRRPSTASARPWSPSTSRPPGPAACWRHGWQPLTLCSARSSATGSPTRASRRPPGWPARPRRPRWLVLPVAGRGDVPGQQGFQRLAGGRLAAAVRAGLQVSLQAGAGVVPGDPGGARDGPGVAGGLGGPFRARAVVVLAADDGSADGPPGG